ncbi:MAG: hypothetical protein JJ971_07505 [Balneolaceae bacterium]|nr:hypothetical protein [Balneolaceae bacterium]MBO6546920.1 hypothetical protein [Balneolaceae bacterium]MBO6649280.1 hypothetical protein [Balneolaceae bacterium]
MLDWFKKGALIITLVFIYFFGIREIRGVILDTHLGTILPQDYGEIQNGLFFTELSSVSFSFYNKTRVIHKFWVYKIPFGLFFLLACIGLIILYANSKFYYYLIGIQIIGGAISFLFLLLTISISDHFIVVPDLISRYLTPLCSLGLVALTYIQQKEAPEA